MSDDVGRFHIGMSDECSGCGDGVLSAGPDAEYSVRGLYDVAVSGHQQAVGFSDHDHHGFESPEDSIGSPIASQLGRGARYVSGEVLHPGLEAFEQSEGIGGAAGKPDEDLAIEQLADLGRVGLEDGVAVGHLSVATDCHTVATADREDGGRMRLGLGRRVVGGLVGEGKPRELASGFAVCFNGSNRLRGGQAVVLGGRTVLPGCDGEA